MLWRTDYSPVVLREFRLPKLSTALLSEPENEAGFDFDKFSGPILFGFGPDTYHGLTVWRKLFDSENWRDFPIFLVRPQWDKSTFLQTRASFPPSLLGSIWAFSDPGDELFGLMNNSCENGLKSKRAGAIFVANGIATHGVFGPPTEDAWEDFTVATKKFQVD